jgi:hypothetical protein
VDVGKAEAREAFGRAVKRFRAGRMNQEQLAEGVRRVLGRPTKYAKQTVISSVETGKAYVPIEDVFAFASALGVEPADMLVAWAQELGEEQVEGWRLTRTQLLQDLDALQGAVRQATASFVTPRMPPDAPGEVQETAALAAELMLLPKRQRRRLFRLVGMFNLEEETK